MTDTAIGSPVTLTESAAKRINAVMSKRGAAGVLRISVEGGGCSGFSYVFSLEEAATAEDTIIERDGAVLAVDPMSLEFLSGCEVDFSNELIGAAFRIINPNATASCGCGTSFAV